MTRTASTATSVRLTPHTLTTVGATGKVISPWIKNAQNSRLPVRVTYQNR